MNRLLATSLNLFNSLLALLVLSIGGLGVFLVFGGDIEILARLRAPLEALWRGLQTQAGQALLITVVAFLIAAYLCGIVAFLALIESHLRALRGAFDSRRSIDARGTAGDDEDQPRQAPRL